MIEYECSMADADADPVRLLEFERGWVFEMARRGLIMVVANAKALLVSAGLRRSEDRALEMENEDGWLMGRTGPVGRHREPSRVLGLRYQIPKIP